MITTPIAPRRRPGTSRLRGHALGLTLAHPSRISANRADRELLFERTHGSLWEHGLLDRLSEPLTRYRE
ncbi:MAG TPA: hypothetical protein VGG34_09445 [Opitutaceae bacterium]|jgi:hypothetical protein